MRYRSPLFLLAMFLTVSATPAAAQFQDQNNTQTIQCQADGYERKYCPVDTRGGVRLTRQLSSASCSQDSSWGYDDRGIWVDNGCRAEFEVTSANRRSASTQTIRCESDNNGRKYCAVDTRGGVRLSYESSNGICRQNSTWGYDDRGIWVDDGCRAEFEIQPSGYGTGTGINTNSPDTQTIRCESNNNNRNYCAVDTRAGVRLTRRFGSSLCTQGTSWGYDDGGIWVDNGCRAEFEVAGTDDSDQDQTQAVLLNMNCGTYGTARKYCKADTRGGVRLVRQISRAACTQGSSWGYNQRGIWVSRRCSGNFDVLALDPDADSTDSASLPSTGTALKIRCESTPANGNARKHCAANTRNGARLTRQISTAACTQGSTWGYDNRGVWVDRGCRGEFELATREYASGQARSLRCESTGTARRYCATDTRGGVRLARQLSNNACTQGTTWDYDNSGIWVSNGCRADFDVYGSSSRNSTSGTTYTIIPSGSDFSVRTNDAIDSKASNEGQTYSATIAEDILNASGAVVIPKGSDVQLVIRSTSGGSITSSSDLVLDIHSVTVRGTKYAPSTTDLERKGGEGIGANKKTGVMVGGGAALGALIGAMVGQGKGAAIGAAIGAAAGAGGVVLTKGKEVNVPAETVLNFKLDQDLRLEQVN